jgi:hypothetical protein
LLSGRPNPGRLLGIDDLAVDPNLASEEVDRGFTEWEW